VPVVRLFAVAMVPSIGCQRRRHSTENIHFK
jgi:hypothetical protein